MEMPSVGLGLSYQKAPYFICGFFSTQRLPPSSGLSEPVKRERLEFRPSVALITSCFGRRIHGRGTIEPRLFR